MLLISGIFLVSGCAWPVRQATNETVRALADHPFDIGPDTAAAAAEKAPAQAASTDKTPSVSSSRKSTTTTLDTTVDTETTAAIESRPDPAHRDNSLADPDVQRSSLIAAQPGPTRAGPQQRKLDLNIPLVVPGAEAPRIVLPRERELVPRAIDRQYPELPPLPAEPAVQPGPDGKPYSLSALQRLAAENNPALRQAAADVEAAKGNLIQAKTYPNPTVGYLMDPSNNNDVAGVQGGFISQMIVTGGKLKLAGGAAQKDLDNAILALKRARTDLATSVRTSYFTLLVDVETLIVTRALAKFTDEIYRAQIGLLRGAQSAPYEPASLRAQAFTARLAYRQAIASYIYDWKQLAATMGLRQLPLSELAGRVDRFIPYYDYDDVLAQVLRNHTDVLTARNAVTKAQYNLKLAQQVPLLPNPTVYASLERDFSDTPFGTYQQMGFSFPLSIWDQNKGNIIAAKAALVRASEESHRAEMNLTSNLAAAYGNYKSNLYAMEEYRRDILPNFVRYYRGVYARRQVDPSSAFNDLVTAQQTLSSNVTIYLNVLQSLWMSVVSVADFLQTDDLFQLGKPHAVPALPDLSRLPDWVCGHETLAAACAGGALASGTATAAPMITNGTPGTPVSAPPVRLHGGAAVQGLSSRNKDTHSGQDQKGGDQPDTQDVYGVSSVQARPVDWPQ
jgi:cobalt-zinc-cadmium efflux system outer membrane protein